MTRSRSDNIQLPILSGPLPDEIGELFARRFPSHKQEHRRYQKESNRSSGSAVAIECNVAILPNDRRRKCSTRAAKRKRRANSGPTDLRREHFGIVAKPPAVAASYQKIQIKPAQNKLVALSSRPMTTRRTAAGIQNAGIT